MKSKKYLCPVCKSELKLVSQPQYHNEYILYFKCNNCNFRTDNVHSYKDTNECIKMMIKTYGIVENNDNNRWDNEIKNNDMEERLKMLEEKVKKLESEIMKIKNINNRNYFENLIN